MNSAPRRSTAKELDARIRELAAQGGWSEIALEIGRLPDPWPVLPATAVNAHKAYRALSDEPSAELWLERALALMPSNATLHRDKGVRNQKRGDSRVHLSERRRRLQALPASRRRRLEKFDAKHFGIPSTKGCSTLSMLWIRASSMPTP